MKYKKKLKKKYNNNLSLDQTFPGRNSRMDKNKQIYIYSESSRLKITYDLFHKHFKLHIWTKKVNVFSLNYSGSIEGEYEVGLKTSFLDVRCNVDVG